MPAEMAMWLSGVVMLVAVAIALWNFVQNDARDRATDKWLVVAIIAFVFFIWAQHQAERKAEIEHAVEQSVVQE